MSQWVGNFGYVAEGDIGRLLPMLVSTKEEWKRALGFVIALAREDQGMTVLRAYPAWSRFSRNVVVLMLEPGRESGQIGGKRQLIPYFGITG
jgi:hypothetical protein